MFAGIRNRLSRLSFRTGVAVLLLCVLFYALSFAQMLLPVSVATKGVLWVVFFGLAKALQYTGLLIVGAEGVRRIRAWLHRRRRV